VKILLVLFLIFVVSCSSTRKSNIPDRNNNTGIVINPAKVPKALPAKNIKAEKSEEAKINLIKATYSKEDYIRVLEMTEAWEAFTSQNYLFEAFDIRIKALSATQDQKKAVELALLGLKHPSLQAVKDSVKKTSEDLILFKVRSSDLEDLLNQIDEAPLRALVYYRLGESNLADREYDSARNSFAKAVDAAADSEWGIKSKSYLEQLESVRRVQPKTIGVVLPMTGKHAAVGKKALRGVQMGLGIYNNLPSPFELAVVDSEGNPDLARRGVDRLVKEDNVIAIIGSVLSKNASAVATRSQELGVPSINLSQKSGITETGASVFRNSLTTEMQTRFLVKYAMEIRGLKNFALMYPNDAYGIEFANVFWDEVIARGGSIRAVQVYSPKETDFRNVVQRLVGTYYIEDRVDEMQNALREQKKDPKKQKSKFDGGTKDKSPEELLEPVVTFDAIFIPDSVKSLGQIAAMLSYSGVKDVKLLGTNLWNNSQVIKRSGAFADNMIFVDSLTDLNNSKSSFVRDYKNLFQEDPGLVEIHAFDSALMIKQLIASGYSSRESLMDGLLSIKQFPGALGPFSAGEDREFLRPMTILTLEKGQIIQAKELARP
jgi:branched-chain amino acid transport system substrate-binding protein